MENQMLRKFSLIGAVAAALVLSDTGVRRYFELREGETTERIALLRLLSGYVLYTRESDANVVVRSTENLRLETTEPWYVGPSFDMFGLRPFWQQQFLQQIKDRSTMP